MEVLHSGLSSPVPPPPTCVKVIFRVPLLQLGVCKGSSTTKESGQDAGERSLGGGRKSWARILQLTFLGSESIRRLEAGD